MIPFNKLSFILIIKIFIFLDLLRIKNLSCLLDIYSFNFKIAT